MASSAALHAKTLAGDCGEFYHSESEDRNGYGENLFVCWGSDTCYSAAGAMQGLCECSWLVIIPPFSVLL